jgi:hypothetical protein
MNRWEVLGLFIAGIAALLWFVYRMGEPSARRSREGEGYLGDGTGGHAGWSGGAHGRHSSHADDDAAFGDASAGDSGGGDGGGGDGGGD